ncbi:hypothetical protein [Bradyrhizobium sp. CCBAU 53380]|nr:hypothetical protein [Bradyrhizobium sp. CCBAU 53380]
MDTPNDRQPLSDKLAPSPGLEHTEEARRVVADYIRDQKEVLKALRRLFS